MQEYITPQRRGGEKKEKKNEQGEFGKGESKVFPQLIINFRAGGQMCPGPLLISDPDVNPS